MKMRRKRLTAGMVLRLFLAAACCGLLVGGGRLRLPVLVGAQELPFVSVPKFQTFDSSRPWGYRTDVCDRQYQLIVGNVTLKQALKGLNLTVAITNYPSPTENELFSLDPVTGGIKQGDDPGLFVILLDEVARRAGFQWRNSYVAIDPLTADVDGNKTWTDLLQWEVNHFDIAADYWARSQERMAMGVSFPKGWYDGSVILAQSLHKQEEKSQFKTYLSFLLPFHYTVWLLIIAATVFTGLMYFLLERLNVESDERELEHKPVVAIFLASLAFTGHFQFRPNTNAARILSFSWSFWALIITSAYTANMASFLVARNAQEVVVATLEDALQSRTPVCIQRFSVMDDVIAKKYPDMNLVRKDTEKELFDGLRRPWDNGGCGAALTNLGTFALYQGNQDVNYDCTLTSERRIIQYMPAGFATIVDTGSLCTSLISYVINIHMTEMISEGFVATAWANHVAKVSNATCQAGDNKAFLSSVVADVDGGGNTIKKKSSLYISEMAGIFVVHLVLLCFAVLIAFVDLRQRIRARRQRRTNS